MLNAYMAQAGVDTVGRLYRRSRERLTIDPSSKTLHTLLTLLLALTIYPQVVDKAQAEIDKVVGTSRLPELADRESLPYLGCIVQEVHRCVHPSFVHFA